LEELRESLPDIAFPTVNSQWEQRWKMGKLHLPESPDELVARLKLLHERWKTLPRPPHRLSLTAGERSEVLGKTAGRCHLCGGEIAEQRFAADHVLAHAAGGAHSLDNYLPAHGLCNGCRWFYSAEEFQWILRMGIWARKHIEDQTPIGMKMLPIFLHHEESVRERGKSGRYATSCEVGAAKYKW
jgi:hypothetical protein